MITISNLSKSYLIHPAKKHTAIQGVSLEIKPGEIVSIVGPSGAGKSTLLNCIVGTLQGYTGQIQIQGQDAQSYFQNKRISLVSQHYSNFPWKTVLDNVVTGFYGQKLSQGQKVKKAEQLLKRVGLYKVKNMYPAALSGGMQQRIAIARAIAQDTQIIALDEPFGALDVQTRAQMQEFLANIWEEDKKTLILVTHDIEEAIFLSDRIFILGASPGTLRSCIEVDIPRPRLSETRFDSEFIKLKKCISYTIRSESIKSNLEDAILPDSQAFKLGLYIWAGNALQYYAKDSGFFQTENLNLEQINFESFKEKLSLWQANKLDAIDVTLNQALELFAKNPDFKIISFLNKSIGGDALVAKKSIKNIQDLVGKVVGLEKDSPAEFLLFAALYHEGLTCSQVKIKYLDSSKIGSNLIAGTIDAGVMWEPWLSKTLELSNVHILKSTQDYPLLYDVIIAKNNVIKEKIQQIKKLNKIWSKSISDFHKHPKDIISIAASHMGVAPKEVSSYLNKLELLDTTPKNLDKTIQSIHDVLRVNARIPMDFKNIEPAMLIYPHRP